MSLPILGVSRDSSCRRTIEVITAKLAAMADLQGRRLLDVGCGDGSFTLVIGERYERVLGIDLQESGLAVFERRVDRGEKFTVIRMSASAMGFADGSFDTLVSIETLEHVSDLEATLGEFRRVLKAGGLCLITCPNRLFPFENHGVRVGGREVARRVPLLPWLPALHDRFALARVFTVRTLDRLFARAGFERIGVDYAWPTFEHGGNPFQRLLRPLYGLMRAMERSPLRCFGSSIVLGYQRTP